MISSNLSGGKSSAPNTQPCVNLKQRFGDRYRITYEESFWAERPEFRQDEEPWLQIIPCRNGHIYPWGGTKLAACTTTSGPVANRLRTLPSVEVAQDGADGVNVVFNVAHFEVVAEIMRPRRRRWVSETERQRLAELSRRYSPFRKKPFSQDAGTAPDCDEWGLGV